MLDTHCYHSYIDDLHEWKESQSQSWGLTSCSTARVILGQVLSIATCGTRTQGGTAYD